MSHFVDHMDHTEDTRWKTYQETCLRMHTFSLSFSKSTILISKWMWNAANKSQKRLKYRNAFPSLHFLFRWCWLGRCWRCFLTNFLPCQRFSTIKGPRWKCKQARQHEAGSKRHYCVGKLLHSITPYKTYHSKCDGDYLEDFLRPLLAFEVHVTWNGL